MTEKFESVAEVETTLLDAARMAANRLNKVVWQLLDDQRARGWPDIHPEDYCHRCGAKNFSWSVDSDRFNLAIGGPVTQWNGIVCPACFVELHEAATGLTGNWRLTPDNFWHKPASGET